MKPRVARMQQRVENWVRDNKDQKKQEVDKKARAGVQTGEDSNDEKLDVNELK